MRIRIWHKLSLTFLIAGITLTVVAGSVFYLIARNEVEKVVSNKFQAVSKLKKDFLDEFFSRNIEDIRGLQIGLGYKYMLQDLEKYKNDTDSPQYKEAMEFLNKRYREYVDVHEEFEYLMLTDTTGEIVFVSTLEAQKCLGKNLNEIMTGEENLFDKAKNRIYQTDIAPCPDREGKYSMILAGPLSLNGDFVGTAVLGINIGEIFKIMNERTGLGETGETYLVGEDFLLRSPSRFTSASAILKTRVDTKATREWYHAHIAEEDDNHPSHAEIHPGEEHKDRIEKLGIYTGYRGVKVLGVHYHIPRAGWGMFAEIDLSEAFAGLVLIRNYLLLIIGIVPILAVLIGLWLSRGITGPIAKLYEGAGIVGKGKLDYRIDVRSKDEVGELAGSFNKMTGDLKRSRQEIEFYSRDLERKVEERTEALRLANEGLKKSNEELALTAQKIRRANQETQKTKKALEEKVAELEQFNKIAVGRELRMAELKERIKVLEARAG